MRKKVLALLLSGVMVFGMGATAMASDQPVSDDPVQDEVDFDGQGTIAKEGDDGTNGPGNMIDVTVPSNGFLWYANEESAVDSNGVKYGETGFDEDDIASYDIKSAQYEIENNSENVSLEVVFVKYGVSESLTARKDLETKKIDASDSEFISEKITVGLAGDLYTEATRDLLNDHPTDTVALPALEPEGKLEYSFYGELDSAKLPEEEVTSDYVMVLEFTAVGPAVED